MEGHALYEDMSYGWTCLMGSHVLWGISYERFCLTRGHILQ